MLILEALRQLDLNAILGKARRVYLAGLTPAPLTSFLKRSTCPQLV